MDDGSAFLSLLLFSAVLGLIPAVIAKAKGRSFAGWWLYEAALFVVALVHSIVIKPDQRVVEEEQIASGAMRKCPWCAEMIKHDALVCRYCRHNVSTSPAT